MIQMHKTIPEAIEYFNNLIEEKNKENKRQFGLEIAIESTEHDVIEYITSYYNKQGIACRMKYCPIKANYEILIWW